MVPGGLTSHIKLFYDNYSLYSAAKLDAPAYPQNHYRSSVEYSAVCRLNHDDDADVDDDDDQLL